MIYEQRTGRLFTDEGELLGTGYAGKGEGKNNPDMQATPFIGPLPAGWYTRGAAYTHEHLGPITMNLTPDEGNEMFGRNLFRIHGDAIADPGNASDGCIVQDHDVRMRVSNHPDVRMHVVPQL